MEEVLFEHWSSGGCLGLGQGMLQITFDGTFVRIDADNSSDEYTHVVVRFTVEEWFKTMTAIKKKIKARI